jgi:hypothetical protein
MHLDYDTMVGADKFGNVCVCRIPRDMSHIVEDDPTGGKLAAANGKLNSAPHKLEPIVNFHVGDLVMSLQLCTLQQGGQEVGMPCTETVLGSCFLPVSTLPSLSTYKNRFHVLCTAAPCMREPNHPGSISRVLSATPCAFPCACVYLWNSQAVMEVCTWQAPCDLVHRQDRLQVVVGTANPLRLINS